ncbi:hypothetical protein GGR52DRAFT_387565 [Hypoxylon sp. FL1284]|nr:hypothetical protein GGR52DRAFT_387565 [Hypoxylon sp. FL1284]
MPLLLPLLAVPLERGIRPFMFCGKGVTSSISLVSAVERCLLYDLDVCVGWFVDGTSALLHLVRAHLTHMAATYKEIGLFQFDDSQLETAPEHVSYQGHLASLSVLTSKHNRNLDVGGSNQESYHETTVEPVPGGTATTQDKNTTKVYKTKETHTCFEQIVKEYYIYLELLFAYENDRCNADGISITGQHRFQGYDFVQIYDGNGDLRAQEPERKCPAHKWADLVQSVGALTLFGKGFGKLIRSSEASQTCNVCFDVPNGQNLLVACGDELKHILDTDEKLWDRIDKTHWHDANQRFRCSCGGLAEAVGKRAGHLPWKASKRIEPPDHAQWEKNTAAIFKLEPVEWHGNGLDTADNGAPRRESELVGLSEDNDHNLSSEMNMSGPSSTAGTSTTPATAPPSALSDEGTELSRTVDKYIQRKPVASRSPRSHSSNADPVSSLNDDGPSKIKAKLGPQDVSVENALRGN